MKCQNCVERATSKITCGGLVVLLCKGHRDEYYDKALPARAAAMRQASKRMKRCQCGQVAVVGSQFGPLCQTCHNNLRSKVILMGGKLETLPLNNTIRLETIIEEHLDDIPT